MKSFLKYLAAFLSGYFGALLPFMAGGSLPSGQQWLAAVVPGLLATGLLHLPSPAGSVGGSR